MSAAMVEPKASLWRTITAVAWSFIGIRRRADHESLGKVNPFTLIAVALAATALFVGSLILLVHWIVH